MSLRAVALLSAIGLALAGAPAGAGAAASLPDVEDEVMCVSCRIPLNTAESPQADRQRALIQRLIDRGRDKEQIKAALVAQYGEGVLALPDEGGFGLTAYLVPIALVTVLAGGLVLLLPRWRRRGGDGPPTSAEAPLPALSASDARRLDEDLARYEA